MPMVEPNKNGAKRFDTAAPSTKKSVLSTPATQEPFRPKVLAFTCKWCTYAGADLAGLNRMKYPADIRLLRVPCSGRVNPQITWRLFNADAMVSWYVGVIQAIATTPQATITLSVA